MHVHLYSGPDDGGLRVLKTDVRYLFIRGTAYTHSAEWSAWFRRPTFVPTYFKGLPRRSSQLKRAMG
jgi:hypothetical protein